MSAALLEPAGWRAGSGRPAAAAPAPPAAAAPAAPAAAAQESSGVSYIYNHFAAGVALVRCIVMVSLAARQLL